MAVAVSPFGAKRIFDPDMSALLPGAKPHGRAGI
jgi:hypothetical protein